MASRFWVGGAGTWDASTTTHWASSSGGVGGASVPGSADSATFDANSGGGTVTVNTTVSVTAITCGLFTGTLDFSVHNNDVNLSANTAFSGSGSGVRTIKLGSGTWTLSAPSTIIIWNMTTTTNLTFSGASATLNFTGNSGVGKTFAGGGLSYGPVSFASQNAGSFNITGANTFASLFISGPNAVELAANQTIAALTLNGAVTAPIALGSSTLGNQRSISVASGTPVMKGVSLTDINFTGGAAFAASDSFDCGNNSGITITPPFSSPRVIYGA